MAFFTAADVSRRLPLRHLFLLRFSTTPSSLQNLFPSSLNSGFLEGHDPNKSLPVTSSSPASGRFAVQLAALRISNVDSGKPNPAASREPFLSTVILSYGSAHMLDRAIATFEDVRRLTAAPPTALSFNAVLSAAIRSRSHNQVPQLFSQLSQKHSISPDKLSYGILIKALCLCGKTDAAFEILKEMETKGIEVTTVTYTTLINSLYKEEKPERADDLWKEMVQKGRNPDLASYNVKIRHHAVKGNLKAVLETVSELISAGLKPERTTYNYLMSCYSRNGRFEDVKRVYEELKSNHCDPNSTTFKVMMKFLCENGDFDAGFDVFKKTMDQNKVPDFLTLKPLVVGLAKSSRIEEAKTVIMVARQRFPANKVGGWKEVEKKLGLDMHEKEGDES
ncbi:Pentatricopeptide repeat-containing protein [Platanthera guangdongensis]|uniref:Pentatricopeptide repeat-containing protein n=1 Tax=Platanthera guangdongensis TaxID=2320717 RepID=A0ABR2MY90_9ASPA